MGWRSLSAHGNYVFNGSCKKYSKFHVSHWSILSIQFASIEYCVPVQLRLAPPNGSQSGSPEGSSPAFPANPPCNPPRPEPCPQVAKRGERRGERERERGQAVGERAAPRGRAVCSSWARKCCGCPSQGACQPHPLLCKSNIHEHASGA